MQYNKIGNIFRRFGCLRLRLSPFIDRKQVVEFLNSRIITGRVLFAIYFASRPPALQKQTSSFFFHSYPFFIYIHVNGAIKATACTAVSYVLGLISDIAQVQSTPDNSKLQGKSKTVRDIGSSKQITGNKELISKWMARECNYHAHFTSGAARNILIFQMF